MTALPQATPSSKVRSSSPVLSCKPETTSTAAAVPPTLSPTSTLSVLADEFGAVVDDEFGIVPAFSHRPNAARREPLSPTAAPLLMLNNFESAVNVLDPSSGALTELNGVETTNDKDLAKQNGTIDSHDDDDDDDSDENETHDGSVNDAALASSMDNHGIERGHLGDWENALECWLEAQAVRASLQDAPEENVARSGNNAGVALFQLGRLEDCHYFFERSVQVVETILSQEKQQRQERRKKKKENKPNTSKQQTTPKSKEWVHQRRRDYGVMLHNLGVALYQMGRHELAMKNLQRAKKVLRAGKNRGDDLSELLAATLYELGLVCSSKGCFPDAWEALDESWRLLDNKKKQETNDIGCHRRQKLLRDTMDKVEDLLANNMSLSFDFSS